MAMDEYLASLYKTGPVADAEDQLIEKIAADLAEEDINIDELEDEEVEALVDEYSDDEEEDADLDEDGTEKTAEAKFAEADYMGRIMAHSYTQELEGIEKEAAKKKKGPGYLAKKYRAGKRGVRRAGKAASELLTRPKTRRELGKARKALGKSRVFRKGVGPVLGGAAALGAGAGYMAKKSSALGSIVEQRALEILEENGYDVE